MRIKNIFIILFGFALILQASIIISASPQVYTANQDVCACYISVEECGWELNPIPFTEGSVWPLRYCKSVDFKLRVGETVMCGKNINDAEYYDCVIQDDKFAVRKMPNGELVSNEEEGYMGNGNYKFEVGDVSLCIKKKVTGDSVQEPSRNVCGEQRKINESDYYQTAPREELSSEENKDLCCTVALGDDVDAFQFSGNQVLHDGPYADGVTNIIKVKKGTPITYGFWWRAQGSDGSDSSSWNGAYDGRTVCNSNVKVIPTDGDKTSVSEIPNGGYLDRFSDIYPLFVEIDPIDRANYCGMKVRKVKKSQDQITRIPQDSSSPNNNVVIGGGGSSTNNNTQNDNDQNNVDLACGCNVKINEGVKWDNDISSGLMNGVISLNGYVAEIKVKKGTTILYSYGVDVYADQKEALSPLKDAKPIKRITDVGSKVCEGNEDIILPSESEIYSLTSSNRDLGGNIIKMIISKYGNAKPFISNVKINNEDLCGEEISYELQEGTIAPEFSLFTIILSLLVSLLAISIIRVKKTK